MAISSKGHLRIRKWYFAATFWFNLNQRVESFVRYQTGEMNPEFWSPTNLHSWQGLANEGKYDSLIDTLIHESGVDSLETSFADS